MLFPRFIYTSDQEKSDDVVNLYRGFIGSALEINIDSKITLSRDGIKKILDTIKRQILQESRSRDILLINIIPLFKDIDIIDLVSFAYENGYHWVQLSVDLRMLFHPSAIEKLKRILSNESIRSRIFLPVQQKNKKTFGLTMIAKHLNQEKLISGLKPRIKKILLYGYPVAVHLFIDKRNVRFIQQAADKFRTWGIRMVILSPIDSVFKRAPFKEIVDCLSGFAREHLLFRDFRFVFKDIPLCLLPKELFFDSLETAGLYDWHKGYKIVYIPQLISEDFYSFESRRKKRLRKCYSCGFSVICRGILRYYLGDRKSRKSVYELLKETALPLKPYTKINQFGDSWNLTFDLRKKRHPNILATIKADAVVFFSGGSDSSLATYLYAKEHPNKKLVLITFLSIPPFLGEKSWFNAVVLMKRCKNIVKHIVIKVPRDIRQELVFKDLEKIYKDIGFYMTCHYCRLLRVTYSIFLLKKFFGGNTILFGLRREELACIPADMAGLMKKIARRYDVDLVCPVFDMTREEVAAEIKKSRLTLAYQFPFQAQCFANFIKSGFRPLCYDPKKIAFYFSKKTEEIDTLLKKCLRA